MMRTIIGVVAHCHNMGVIHRDLKVQLGHGTQGEELRGHTALTVACSSFRATMCSLSLSLLQGFPFLFCFDPPLNELSAAPPQPGLAAPFADLPVCLPVQPENFLLLEKSETATLKSTDFGLSSFFQVSRGFIQTQG